MKKSLLAIGLFLLSCGASAATYYVSDCAGGAVSQCVAGNDASAGTSPSSPWKTCAKVASQFSALGGGDQVLFARGSAQGSCQMNYLSNPNSRRATPITIGAYDAPWAGGQLATPLLYGPPDNYTLSLLNSGNSTHDEGYVIQDLHFRGPGVSSTMFAIILGNDVDYVTLRRLEIDEYRGGIQCEGGTNHALSPGSDGLTEHLVIQSSYVHNNRGMGLLVSCSDSLIENNRLDSNGVGALDHHIYIGGSALNNVAIVNRQIVIRGNNLTNNSPYATRTSTAPTVGGCAATAIVIHGLNNGIVVENNKLIEPPTAAAGPCWGISADSGGYTDIYAGEGFSNIFVRDNLLANYDMGIGIDLCDTCTVENNDVYSERVGASGIVAPAKFFQAAVAGNKTNNRLTIRNNSVYIKNPGSSSVGIMAARDGGNHTVVSNLVYFGAGGSSQTSCFNTAGLATSAFSLFDYNLCYFSSTQGAWDSARSSLSAQRAAGLDQHSVGTNPGLVTPSAPTYTLSLGAGSVALSAGHPTASSKFGFGGVKRLASPDIGAHQASGTVVVPNSPTSMGIR